MWPTELALLDITQFSKMNVTGIDAWYWRGVWVFRWNQQMRGGWPKDGTSKAWRCGDVWWRWFRWNGQCYNDISQYIQISNTLEMAGSNSNLFFPGLKKNGMKPADCFRCQPLGVHSIWRIIQSIWKSLWIDGNAENNGIAIHSLRVTVAYMLIKAGRPNSTITIRTGHRKTDSLKYYQNIRGKEGKTQQRIIFQSTKCEASQVEREISPRPSKWNRLIQCKKGCREKGRIPTDILNSIPSDPRRELHYGIIEENGSVSDSIASDLRSVKASCIRSDNDTVHYHGKKT